VEGGTACTGTRVVWLLLDIGWDRSRGEVCPVWTGRPGAGTCWDCWDMSGQLGIRIDCGHAGAKVSCFVSQRVPQCPPCPKDEMPSAELGTNLGRLHCQDDKIHAHPVCS
jgi:hypothetical protein